jgi:hypothetical protein
VVLQPTEQCPHYEARVVVLVMPTKKLSLTIPVCRLAHRMGERLNTTAEGQSISRLLTTTTLDGETRFLYGPDLDPITAPLCHRERLHHVCEPEFGHILTRLGLDASLPQTD